MSLACDEFGTEVSWANTRLLMVRAFGRDVVGVDTPSAYELGAFLRRVVLAIPHVRLAKLFPRPLRARGARLSANSSSLRETTSPAVQSASTPSHVK